MDAPTPAASSEAALESGMAEEICTLLEQAILKYFPPIENEVDRPKSSSVPLIPQRPENPST